MPGFESRRDEPELAKDYWVKNIHNPSITPFLPPKEKATGAAVIICPDGGHRELVYNLEGADAARYLSTLGVAAFALKYRLGREQGSPYKLQVHARAPVEIHVFARGGHGFSMGQRSKLATVSHWPQRLAEWMNDNAILDPSKPARGVR